MLEEVLGLVRAWWAGETVTHRSERWSFTELASPGRPVQDPLEVWLGGRGPKALDRVGRVADGWLGAQLTPAETGIARGRIQEAAARAGREVDPEHFGLSIAYTHGEAPADVLRAIAARRRDVDPRELRAGRRVGAACVHRRMRRVGPLEVRRASGASPSASWAEEAGWLADAILDLQT